jgi:PPOX class probable F420-dependent enzyme
METTEALEYIRANHRGVLITSRSDGGLQSSPVTASTDDEGRVIVSSRETAIKVKNLRRDARATYCGFTDGFYGPWVQVEGPAEIVSLPEALELLVDYYRDVAGEHPDWDDYRAAMVREQRVLIRITVERAGPSRSG